MRATHRAAPPRPHCHGALILFLLLAARPVTAQVTSASTWQSFPLEEQTDTFTVELDMRPEGDNIDGVTGFANGTITAYDDTPVALRFNDRGTIDAIDGDWYDQANVIPYTAGTTYHFRTVVRIATSDFSATVTPDGGVEQTLAVNHAFRTSRPTVPRLDTWGLIGEIGSYVVSNVSVVHANPDGDGFHGAAECDRGEYYDYLSEKCVRPEASSCAETRSRGFLVPLLALLGVRLLHARRPGKLASGIS